MAEVRAMESKMQRNVLELADRNSKEVSCTGVGSWLKIYTEAYLEG